MAVSCQSAEVVLDSLWLFDSEDHDNGISVTLAPRPQAVPGTADNITSFNPCNKHPVKRVMVMPPFDR